MLKNREVGTEVNVRGWVRTRRSSKQVAFVALNDGSTINNVQVVIDAEKFDEELVKQFTTGACLSVNGLLVESIGGGQSVEIQATEIELLGACDSTLITSRCLMLQILKITWYIKTILVKVFCL